MHLVHDTRVYRNRRPPGLLDGIRELQGPIGASSAPHVIEIPQFCRDPRIPHLRERNLDLDADPVVNPTCRILKRAWSLPVGDACPLCPDRSLRPAPFLSGGFRGRKP